MNIKKSLAIIFTIIILSVLVMLILAELKKNDQEKYVIEREDKDKTIELVEHEQNELDLNISDEFKYIKDGIIKQGDSFVVPMLNLKVTINEVILSTNIFNAGWNIDDFYLNEAMVVLDSREKTNSVNMLRDNLDYKTGELAEGLTLVSVDVTVKNLNSANTTFGPETNTFGNDVLYLVNARIKENEPNALAAYKSVACSCEKNIPGQYTWVHIQPGGETRYKLAYIADDYIKVDNGFIASYDMLQEGVCYFPLVLGEIR